MLYSLKKMWAVFSYLLYFAGVIAVHNQCKCPS